MATISIPRRVCDRPGCGETVTKAGGRYTLMTTADLREGSKMGDMLPGVVGPLESLGDDGVDLCRACKVSLVTWWTSIERRAAEKSEAT